jgi:Tfp pilus assembly protein PilF
VVLLGALGRLLIRQGPSRYVEAIGYLRAARGQRPYLGITLGDALLCAGRPVQAEELMEDLVRRQPDNPSYSFHHGVTLFQRQNYERAEAAFRRAIDLRPDYAAAHNNLGCALYYRGKPGEAEAAFRKAIEQKPDLGLAIHHLGLALMRQGRFDEAAASLKKAGELLPPNHPRREQARQLEPRCRRYAALDARLPAILRGAEKPAGAAEQIELAEVCYIQRAYTAAARFSRDAFEADP